MAPTLRILSYLGFIAGLLGSVASLIALELMDVGGNFQTLLREDERRREVENRQEKLARVARFRRQITEELIDGERCLMEVALLYQQLNKTSIPMDFSPWGESEENAEDEWLCRQVRHHAVALAANRSSSEAERVARMIETKMEEYRDSDGRIHLAPEMLVSSIEWDCREE